MATYCIDEEDPKRNKTTAEQRLCESTSARVPGEHLAEDRQARTPGPVRQAAWPASCLVNIDKLDRTAAECAPKYSTAYQALSPQKKKKNRFYNQLISGMTWNRFTALRFMTITSAPDSPDIEDSFKILVQRIRRQTPARMLKAGYVGPRNIKRYYPDKDPDEPIHFEYCGCRTAEGHGVIHLVYSGDYLPQPWIKKTWTEIHGAWNVNIQAVKPGEGSRTAGYMIKQYLAGQDLFIRMLHSRNWIYPGARQDFLTLIRRMKALHGDTQGFLLGLQEWNEMMKARKTLNEWTGTQQRLPLEAAGPDTKGYTGPQGTCYTCGKAYQDCDCLKPPRTPEPNPVPEREDLALIARTFKRAGLDVIPRLAYNPHRKGTEIVLDMKLNGRVVRLPLDVIGPLIEHKDEILSWFKRSSGPPALTG